MSLSRKRVGKNLPWSLVVNKKVKKKTKENKKALTLRGKGLFQIEGNRTHPAKGSKNKKKETNLGPS